MKIKRSVFPQGGLGLCLVLLVMTGCASSVDRAGSVDPADLVDRLAENPPRDGVWRPHVLARCAEADMASVAAEQALATSFELYNNGECGDGIAELEMFLDAHEDEGLLLLALAQMYVLAGQGEPKCLPTGGPAGDVGDWSRNRIRLLARAEDLLHRAAALRPDDSVVDFLLADMYRARGDLEEAKDADFHGTGKCTLTRSFEILRMCQGLGAHAVRMLEGVSPEYPVEAQREGLEGEVVLDLLIDPEGDVAQVVIVRSPAPCLGEAASIALRQGHYEAARMGKYPLWAWLRVPVRFGLKD